MTIAAITGGNRVTITDETHPLGQSFDVMNGIDGSDGQTGPQGPQGNPGQGVPTGGTDGQILAKNGSSDYQTRWINPIPDALPIISDEYDEHTAYSVGDYCINENTLYKCNTDINPYEVWDPTHWDPCTVGEEIAAANSEIDTINASLTQLGSDVTVTAKSGITLVRGTSYRMGALVGGTVDFKLTASANTWIDIADIDYIPTNMAQMPCVNTSNGTFGGLIQITTGGVIRLYPPTAINNTEISFTFNYKCVLS